MLDESFNLIEFSSSLSRVSLSLMECLVVVIVGFAWSVFGLGRGWSVAGVWCRGSGHPVSVTSPVAVTSGSLMIDQWEKSNGGQNVRLSDDLR